MTKNPYCYAQNVKVKFKQHKFIRLVELFCRPTFISQLELSKRY